MQGSDLVDQWRLTWQHSPIALTLVGLDGRLLHVNRAMTQMLGYDAEELTRRGFQELTHPDDLDADMELFGQALAGQIDSYRMRKRYLHADGHVVWGDLAAALVRGPAGDPLHFVSQILDVTEQRRYEERVQAATAEIEREHRTLEAIFEAVGVGLLVIGTDGHYERMNRRHQETMSLAFPDGHLGQAGQLGEVFRLDGRTRMTQEEMPSYQATHGAEFDDLRYWVGPDPSSRSAFSVSARQVRGPSGERLGAALAYQDVTALMRAMRVQDEFVSSVSHELRTPLTSVLGYLEILCEQEGIPSDVADQLRTIQRNASRLRVLLSDLLLVGQVREGNLELHRAAVDLAAVVREAAEAVQPLAEQCGVSLTTVTPDRLPTLVDEQRIRQVLDNLLSNAVKYSEGKGTVTLTLAHDSDTIQLEVRDTGMGIDPQEADRIFDRFFRGGKALAGHIPGTGLGLNIVKSIVAAHEGTIELDSEVGRGTAFRVTLPHG